MLHRASGPESSGRFCSETAAQYPAVVERLFPTHLHRLRIIPNLEHPPAGARTGISHGYLGRPPAASPRARKKRTPVSAPKPWTRASCVRKNRPLRGDVVLRKESIPRAGKKELRTSSRVRPVVRSGRWSPEGRRRSRETRGAMFPSSAFRYLVPFLESPLSAEACPATLSLLALETVVLNVA